MIISRTSLNLSGDRRLSRLSWMWVRTAKWGGQNLSVAGFSTESIPVYLSHGSNFRSHDNLDAWVARTTQLQPRIFIGINKKCKLHAKRSTHKINYYPNNKGYNDNSNSAADCQRQPPFLPVVIFELYCDQSTYDDYSESQYKQKFSSTHSTKLRIFADIQRNQSRFSIFSHSL